MKNIDHYPSLKRTFRLPRNEGPDKVIPLNVAISSHIKPRYKIHIPREAGAAANEIVRQFSGKNPRFTIITSVFTGNALNLFFSGMVSRIITSLIAHIYPSPYPVKGIIDAYKKDQIEIESWSLYTLEQRLMAGATGLSFLPANSILDTSLIEENPESFRLIEDPFDNGKKTGVVKALQPDISIIHACASDRYGNAILPMPCEDNIWGPRASREGVILTTERLVSSDYIRARSALVKIPGYLVKSVSLAPFGSHPIGLFSPDMAKGINYAIDYDFLTAYRKAGMSPDGIKSWLKEWVLDCPDNDAYLRKLGRERIASLKEKTLPENQKENLKSLALKISNSEATPGEWMTVAACRKIIERVLNQELRTIQAGIGASYLSAAMAYYMLRDKDYYIDMATGGGQVGFSPFPGDPSGGSTASISTCKMLTDSTEAYGTVVGGQGNRCLCVLGTSQIDACGNLNTSRSNGGFLLGTGGAPDGAQSLETLVVGKASRERLLPEISYISTSGKKVCAFVSQLGVMEKKDNEFALTSYFNYHPGFSKEDIIENIRKECGWEMKISPNVKEEPPPTERELIILRALDPEAAFTTL